MMTMVKVVLFMLVVFKATALENSHVLDSNHQASTNVDEQKQSTIDCAIGCALSCQDKKSFKKILCIGICLGKCLISPSDSLDEIDCAVECIHSAAENLRYDSTMMNDHISSCSKQCTNN